MAGVSDASRRAALLGSLGYRFEDRAYNTHGKGEKEAKGGVDHLHTAPIPPGGGRGRRPAADSEATDSSERERCLDFAIGACHRGTSCRYLHVASDLRRLLVQQGKPV